MNHNIRNQGQIPTGDQSALSLLVNAADGRDANRGQRDLNSMSRTLAESLGLRGISSDGSSSLEEQMLLQQSSSGAFQNQASMGFLNQLRDQNMLLSQLSQQQQLASILGLGGGGASQGPDIRQALAAQLRQSQASQNLTNADLLALTRAGAFVGLPNIFGGGGFNGSNAQTVGYNLNQFSGGYGIPGNPNLGFGSPSTQTLASGLENLQRLDDRDRRQRFPVPGTEAGRISSPAVNRVESSLPTVSSGVKTEQATEQQSTASLNDSTQRIKSPMIQTTNIVSNETVDQEPEKPSGAVIVPCRARGMPMDHHFKTAFFVIPENVKHGEELICSYFACRNAGIKFRYCSHCKVPVAKRNFRKRHKHGRALTSKGDDDNSADGDDDDDDVCVPVKKGIPFQITATCDELGDADGISSQSADSASVKNSNAGKDISQEVQVHVQSQESKSDQGQTNVQSSVMKQLPFLNTETKITEKRLHRWLSLLAKRPSTKLDEESMSAWLEEVITVSDLETPLRSDGEFTDDLKNEAVKKHQEVEARKRKTSEIDSPEGTNVEGDELGPVEHNSRIMIEQAQPPHSSFNGNIVKKKRPAFDFLDDSKPNEASYARGTFAEWKERKKQKKQNQK